MSTTRTLFIAGITKQIVAAAAPTAVIYIDQCTAECKKLFQGPDGMDGNNKGIAEYKPLQWTKLCQVVRNTTLSGDEWLAGSVHLWGILQQLRQYQALLQSPMMRPDTTDPDAKNCGGPTDPLQQRCQDTAETKDFSHSKRYVILSKAERHPSSRCTGCQYNKDQQ